MTYHFVKLFISATWEWAALESGCLLSTSTKSTCQRQFWGDCQTCTAKRCQIQLHIYWIYGRKQNLRLMRRECNKGINRREDIRQMTEFKLNYLLDSCACKCLKVWDVLHEETEQWSWQFNNWWNQMICVASHFTMTLQKKFVYY